MNVNTIATLASDLPKLKKADIFKSLLELIDKDDNQENSATYAYLYKQFQPAPTTKPKNAFQWIGKAMAKKDVRYYLKYVYVDLENIVATDGHRLHIMPNSDHLEPGFYNRNGHKVEVDANYPNYERVIQREGIHYHNARYVTKEVVSTGDDILGDCYDIKIGMTVIRINKKYFDDALSLFPDRAHEMGIATSGSLQIRYADNLSIIMQMKK